MTSHSNLDHDTLLQLWKLVTDAEDYTKDHHKNFKNIYIRSTAFKGQKTLKISNEGGNAITRFFNWCARFLNQNSYKITNDSITTRLLKQLHDKTVDVREEDLLKAISTSRIEKNGLSDNEVLAKIKVGCRTINLILQQIMQRKLVKVLESRQESIKDLFTTLFLPSWGLADQRKAEILRASEQLSRAKAAVNDAVVDVVEKIQNYLDAATAQLNVAMTSKEEAESLLSQAKRGHSHDSIEVAFQRAEESAKAADNAANQVTDIVKEADELVRAKDQNQSQPIINFAEVEVLKKFREIVNVVGQVSEYAHSARNAVAEIAKLTINR